MGQWGSCAWLNVFITLEICCCSWDNLQAILDSFSAVTNAVTRKRRASQVHGQDLWVLLHEEEKGGFLGVGRGLK